MSRKHRRAVEYGIERQASSYHQPGTRNGVPVRSERRGGGTGAEPPASPPRAALTIVHGEWVCSDCGAKVTRLPFAPTPGFKIRCDACFRAHKLKYAAKV